MSTVFFKILIVFRYEFYENSSHIIIFDKKDPYYIDLVRKLYNNMNNNKNNNSNNKTTTFKTLLMLSIISMMLVLGGIISVHALPGDQLLEINNPVPDRNDYFGHPVATTSTGDLLVGAFLDDTGATDAGSVYLFDGNDGSLLLTINNPTPDYRDWFGGSVATR